MKATFDDEIISFQNYPFPGASVYGKAALSYSAIRDVDPTTTPPEIRTITGETLFVSAEQRGTFQNVVRDKSLKIVQRPDVWSLILEPFLDTEFSADHSEQTWNRLSQMGISKIEVRRIRNDVDASMISYNSLLWEWCHLSLCLLYTSPSPRDATLSRMPSSA